MDILLDGPQRFENLCAVVRTLEVFGFDRCLVIDPFRLVRERHGKRRRRVARGVSAGAFERVDLVRVDAPDVWLAAQTRRIVATVATDTATLLPDFSFRPDDLIVFGNESSGVSPAVLAHADTHITIPQRGQTRSLNLAVAAGMVLYAAQFGQGAPG